MGGMGGGKMQHESVNTYIWEEWEGGRMQLDSHIHMILMAKIKMLMAGLSVSINFIYSHNIINIIPFMPELNKDM